MPKEKPYMFVAIALLAVLITLYLRSESTPNQPQAGGVEENLGPAPDISLPIGPGGKRVDLSSMKGHVVMLDFWATWCGPCKMSIPDLQAIWEKHKADGLQVVGISVDEPTASKEVDSTVTAMGMTYPITMIDKIPDIRNKYTFASIPLLVIIDKKGVIRARINGYDPTGDNEKLIKKLLAEKG